MTDTQEEFNHYIQGVSQGVISKAELRNWIIPSETLEESKKAIQEIEEETSSVDKLLSDDNNDDESKSDDKKGVNDENNKDKR